MHAKIKIRDNVTPEEAAQYGRVYAATTTKGWTTNQSYIMGSWGAVYKMIQKHQKIQLKV